jgi:hypothetical protein
VGVENQAVDMFRNSGCSKLFIGSRDTEISMGWVIRRKKGIKQPAKLAFANETDVTDFYSRIKSPWTWLPQSMSVCRIFQPELVAEDIIVGHDAW